MVVHMFRVYVGRGKMSVSDLERSLVFGDWVSSNAEWTEDNTPHTLTETNTEMDGTGETYYSLSVRFLMEDAKTNLLQKFTDKLKDKVGWYRVGYHECSHDAEDPEPCGWQDAVEYTSKDTTIPTEIPTFEVNT